MNAVFWNVAGTAGLKSDGWGYLRGFEIIGLVETWEKEGKSRRAEQELRDYEVEVRYAVREKKKGRAKGGMLLGVKKELKLKIEWMEKTTDEAIAARWRTGNEDWLWGITYMRHHKKENFKVMEEWIEKNKEGITVLNGDFNARTASEGGLWDTEGEKEDRKSKDRSENEDGKELVSWLEEHGVGIGNGSTEGD